MRLFSKAPDFDFMRYRRMAMVFSAVMMLLAVVLLGVRGLELGIDFKGGVSIEFSFDNPADLEQIRERLTTAGINESEVKEFGDPTEVLILIPPLEEGDDSSDTISRELETLLRQDDPSASWQRTAVVGSEVGEDFTEQGGLAMLFSLILIFGYVMLRFRWKFAAGAILALVHDVLLTFGFFSITGLTFDLSTLAAVLAVIGYSLNDTIVVFDRIRENFRVIRRGSPQEVVNTSINQTLARTIITGATTLLVLMALLVLGGETVATFAIALIVGIIVGTYSSIYVASAAALFLDVSQQDLIPVKVEEVDSMP